MDHNDTQTLGKRLKRTVGLPDGNGQGVDVWKLTRAAVVTTTATILTGWAINSAWAQAVAAVSATAIVYQLPAVVHGPTGQPERGLVKKVEALETQAAALKAQAVDPDDAATIAEFARNLRADKAKKQRRPNP